MDALPTTDTPLFIDNDLLIYDTCGGGGTKLLAEPASNAPGIVFDICRKITIIFKGTSTVIITSQKTTAVPATVAYTDFRQVGIVPLMEYGVNRTLVPDFTDDFKRLLFGDIVSMPIFYI